MGEINLAQLFFGKNYKNKKEVGYVLKKTEVFRIKLFVLSKSRPLIVLSVDKINDKKCVPCNTMSTKLSRKL